jgi:Fe-S cluster biogenesis protein NfuA
VPLPITIALEPIDEARCRVILNRRLGGGVRRFPSASAAAAAGVPLAQALFDVPGISQVEVAENVVTLTRPGGAPWRVLEERIRYAITTALGADEQPRASAPADAATLDDNAMFEAVNRIFADMINPEIARHGGRVELLDVQDATVILRMLGGCQGCGMASVTLRQGIEATLRQQVPGVQGITDITDHAAGTNPYFAEAKK